MASTKKIFYQLLRYSRFNQRFLNSFVKRKAVDRLHLGCGPFLLAGWCNIAYEPGREYGKPKNRNGAWYLNYDLNEKWPWPENSISFIASAHFIEHLNLDNSLECCFKAFKVLKSGGVLRFSFPDLEIYTKNYVAQNSVFFDNKYIRSHVLPKQAQTYSQIFAAKAYEGEAHKWFHDFSSIKNVMERCGFVNVKKLGRLEGKTPDLQLLELPEREIETAYVEGEKP